MLAQSSLRAVNTGKQFLLHLSVPFLMQSAQICTKAKSFSMLATQ